MFPKEHKDLSYIGPARRLCRTCPVYDQCEEWALSFPANDMHGIWASWTPGQLAAIIKVSGDKPSRLTLAQSHSQNR